MLNTVGVYLNHPDHDNSLTNGYVSNIFLLVKYLANMIRFRNNFFSF